MDPYLDDDLASVLETITADRDECCIDGEAVVSYSGLIKLASSIRQALQASDAVQGSVVVCEVSRSTTQVAAFVAVLSLGGVYVPVDPSLPNERRRIMREESGATLVVEKSAFSSGVVVRRILCQSEIRSSKAAYIVFTSGTTGKPQGVLVGRDSLAHLFHLLVGFCGVCRGEKTLLFASPSFDASIFEMALALVNHATLIVAPNSSGRVVELAALIQDRKVAVATLPPSLLATMPMVAGEHLRTVISAGEHLPVDVAKRWMRVANVVNAYGPTEATVIATAGPVSVQDLSSGITIGQPVRNILVTIEDEQGPVPAGVEGEIVIGGRSVAQGYLGDGLEASKKFFERRGQRWYRTGDAGVACPDGRIKFRGRVDSQIKLWGVRVELEEIEAQLVLVKGVEQAMVLALKDQDGHPRTLVAFIVKSSEQVSGDFVMSALAEVLPASHLPSELISVPNIPLTLTGKRDGRALIEGYSEGRRHQLGHSSAGHVGEVLERVWRDLLHTQTVLSDDDFFEMGGSSLDAIRLIAELRGHGLDVSLADLRGNSGFGQLRSTCQMREKTGVVTSALAKDGQSSGVFPLTSQQLDIWVAEQIRTGPAYVAQSVVAFQCPIKPELFEQALSQVVSAHQGLRVRLAVVAGEAILVQSTPRLSLVVHELSTTTEDGRYGMDLVHSVAREVARVKDLTRYAPMARWDLFVDGSCSWLLQSEHHLMHDGMSSSILTTELIRAYQGLATDGLAFRYMGQSTLGPFLTRQRDEAMYHREWAQELARRALDETPSVTTLPIDRQRPVRRSGSGCLEVRVVEAATVDASRLLARQHKVTRYPVLACVTARSLSKFNGQTSQVLGCGLSNRTTPEELRMVGMALSVLPVKVEVRGEDSVHEILTRVAGDLWWLQDKASLPLALLAEESRLAADRGGLGLFTQVMLSEHDTRLEVLGGETPGRLSLLANGGSKCDLVIVVVRQNDESGSERWEVRFEYDDQLYEKPTATRFADTWVDQLKLLSGTVDG